ncbi:hypothetical protein M8J75_015402 [Diaphorina citri]|nr:hypothetical protein M8J75_015402 [Diaphorina citri]
MYEAKCLVMDYQNHSNQVATQHLQQLHSLAPDTTSARWTQYQQLWRQHHMFINNSISNGKTNCKESSDKSKEDSELWSTVEAQAAFLGPNIWDKTLPYDSDLKYVDLDEFLSDNGIPVDGNTSQTSTGGAPTPAANLTGGHTTTTTLQNVTSTISGRLSPCGSSQASVMTKRERSPSPSEPMSPLTISPPSPADSTLSFTSSTRDFDPRSRTFSDEELKPQPMVKKSRKQFVPDGLKDEKYWARRRKNNMAAKRSRDARRMKENQIALRAGFLEKENMGLRQEMERLKKENLSLRDKLSKFTDLLS